MTLKCQSVDHPHRNWDAINQPCPSVSSYQSAFGSALFTRHSILTQSHSFARAFLNQPQILIHGLAQLNQSQLH